MAKAQVSERLVGLGLETGLQSLGLDDFLPKAGQRIGLGAAPCVWFWLLLSNVEGTGNSLSLQGGTDRMNTHTHTHPTSKEFIYKASINVKRKIMQHKPSWRCAGSKPSRGWMRSSSKRRNNFALPSFVSAHEVPSALGHWVDTELSSQLSWIIDLAHIPHPHMSPVRCSCLQHIFIEHLLGAKHCVRPYI